MATKRTNYAKAQVWLTDMKLECEGTISAVCVRLFECIRDTAVRAKVLKVLRAQHEASLRKANPVAPELELELEFQTDAWWEAVWAEQERISEEVQALVNAMTADLPQAMDEAVRERLTEQFRFWRN